LPEGFDDVAVVSGLAKPTSMAFAPDGRLFVTEQEGRVRVVKDGVLLDTPFLALATDSSGERGLLGLAFDGEGPATPLLYVYYTRLGTAANRLSRYRPSRNNPDVADPASEEVLLDDLPSAHFHNGGALHFAPDGTLLVAVGDAEAPESAQDLGALSGKLLRLDRDGKAPPSNPFANQAAARPEIWAYGFRNPFTFAVEPGGGRVLINDVGSHVAEEIDLGTAGANYGWPACEGRCGEAADPVYQYKTREEGCAVTGGVFGRGLRFPEELEASYFFSDYCGLWIRRLAPSGPVAEFARELEADSVDLDVGPDGHLYRLSYGAGTVRRIEFVGAGNRRPVAVASATPDSGLAPLSVVLSAGASSDPDGDVLSFAWDFGDGSARAVGPVATHSYASNGPYPARVTVSDPRGGQATATAQVVVGQPPLARILAPAPGATARPGELVAFSGEAVDPDAGPLPAEALVWTVVLHHHAESDRQHHTHPFLGPLLGASGSFRVPETLHDADLFLRVQLVATDADRLGHAVATDVRLAPR
jgi:glucose/arabinose dehydrogenase